MEDIAATVTVNPGNNKYVFTYLKIVLNTSIKINLQI